MMKKSNLSIVLLSTLISFNAVGTEISTNAALMQAMDKVTGRVNKVTVPVKSKLAFGDFSMVLRECKKRPAEETPENFAFIDVTDKSFGAEEYNIFRGWILSSTPGISAIEHPIYDVWLLECIDTDVDEKTLLSQEELDARDAILGKSEIVDKNINQPAESEEVEHNDEPKVIRIKEFIEEDRDIEKNIKEVPSYISETNTSYESDIEEGEEPENLLLFTKMQEIEAEHQEKANIPATNSDDDLSKAIDAEINELKNN